MKASPSGYKRLENSTRTPAAGARRVGPADPAETLSVTLRVRRRPDAPPLPDPKVLAAMPAGQRKYLSRDEFAARYGAAPADLEKVADFARGQGLTVIETNVARRTVVASGTVEQMSRAFAVELGRYETPTHSYRGREGQLQLPADIAGIVEGVFGLDNRQMARPLHARITSPTLSVNPLTPPQVAKLYDFPSPPTAAGETIGLIEFGGGYRLTDVDAYFAGLGLAVPAITAVGVDGATNAPGVDTDEDTEVALDIAVAGAVAPGAKIVVYFAPWSEEGWVDVITTAIHDTANHPSVVSISWGWPEQETIQGLDWSKAAIDAVSTTFQEAAALGVTILAASGDSGSGCGIGDHKAHVLYPASDPWVTACGGTTIENVSGSSFSQLTWTTNGTTGGGISDIFPLPDWQASASVPGSVNDGHKGRGIPDVGGNADPASGYMLVLDGAADGPVGGTSATAPLYAGLVALLNAGLGEPVGYLNPNLYALAGPFVFHDVADGKTNATGGAPGYAAGAGWDACTGFGSIDGSALMTALRGVGLPPALAAFGGKLAMTWKGVERDDRIFYSAFNGASWAVQQAVAGVGTSAGTSLAVWNGKLYMAWKGILTDERIFWSAFDGAAWSPQQVVPGVGTSTGPSLAVFKGALYMAWKGQESDQGIYWSSFNGTSWAPQQSVAGVGTSVAPSLAVFGNALYMGWKGIFGDQGIYWSSFNGTSWAPQQHLAGVGTSEGPSLAVLGNVLHAAWKGQFGDQGIYWSTFNGTSWAPQKLVSGVSTSTGPALGVFNNALYMAWKGISGDERIFWSTFTGTVWVAQKVVPGVGTSPDLASDRVA